MDELISERGKFILLGLIGVAAIGGALLLDKRGSANRPQTAEVTGATAPAATDPATPEPAAEAEAEPAQAPPAAPSAGPSGEARTDGGDEEDWAKSG